jgi:branched-chain amino acid transport system ATP-binding protein
MSARRIEVLPLPDFMKPKTSVDGAVLAASHIAKSFGGIKAVQGVDIAIADRTLHALIGPNGAGKTTAFNLLSGMYKPDRREVSLLGADRRPYAGRYRQGRHRAFVPDHQPVSRAQCRREYPPCRAGTASAALRSLTNALSISAINARPMR